MSSIEDAIQVHKSIADQFNVTNAVSSYINNSGIASYLNTVNELKQNLCLQPAFIELLEELRAFQRVQESVLQGATAFYNIMQPILQEYQVMAGITSVIKQVQSSVQPVRDYLQSIQPILQESQLLVQLSEIRKQVVLEPSIITSLQQALEAQIDDSVWQYDVEQDDLEELLEEEMSADFLELAECEDKEGAVGRFIAKWGEQGKKILVTLVRWLLATFIGGLLNYCSEPIYKVIAPTVCLQEADVETTARTELPVNTEIHVWNDVTNNFIEITYEIEAVEHQGYITQETLNANTELISDEVELQHLIFVSDSTELLADRWGMMPEQVYAFLKDDTDLLNGYLLKHYDVLSLLDEEDFVEALEKYCENEGIVIPNSEAESPQN